MDAQWGLYLEYAIHTWALSCGLWHACIFYEAALNHSDKQRCLLNIMPDFHAIIHPSIHPLGSKLLFFFVAANATARTETKLSLWPPKLLLLVCWYFCLFSLLPLPQPLFLFQSFTKNFFSSYIFFPLFISAPASHGLENHVLSTVAVAWQEKKISVCQSSFLRGQRSEVSPTLILPTFDLPLTSGST